MAERLLSRDRRRVVGPARVPDIGGDFKNDAFADAQACRFQVDPNEITAIAGHRGAFFLTNTFRNIQSGSYGLRVFSRVVLEE